jgi:hypothetical protein
VINLRLPLELNPMPPLRARCWYCRQLRRCSPSRLAMYTRAPAINRDADRRGSDRHPATTVCALPVDTKSVLSLQLGR